MVIQYSQVGSNSCMSQDRVKFKHRGRVMLNKLCLGKVCSSVDSPLKYFSFSMYCVGDMDGCMKVAIFFLQ